MLVSITCIDIWKSSHFMQNPKIRMQLLYLQQLLCSQRLSRLSMQSYWNFTHRMTVLISIHYSDVIMIAMASQIISVTFVYSTVYLGADQRKHQSPASLAFVRAIHRWPVNSPHKRPVTWQMLPFDDVIMLYGAFHNDWTALHLRLG